MWGIIVLGINPSQCLLLYSLWHLKCSGTVSISTRHGGFQRGIKGDFPGRPQIGLHDLCERLYIYIYVYCTFGENVSLAEEDMKTE